MFGVADTVNRWGAGMMSCYVALTALTGRVCPHELGEAAAALQIQVLRDFFPEWGVSAVVSAASFDAIPAGAVPIIVHDALNDAAANGFHRTHRDDTPYVLVPYGPNWPLAASHELLRMLANPSGSARVAGQSRMYGQGTVEYLLDVCAPCQDITASYAIDGVAVSDFCNRACFGGSGVATSYTGAVRKAFEPVANGIVTWLADDDLVYQARADRVGQIRVHGGFSTASRGRMLLREMVDILTPNRLPQLSNAPRTPLLLEAEQNSQRAHVTNMKRFREEIAWRFGEAPVRASGIEPPRKSRRPSSNVFAHLAPSPPRMTDNPQVTVRSTS
jgi:hypothetical protein